MSKRRRYGIVSVPCPANPGTEHPIGLAYQDYDDGADEASEEIVYSDRTEGAHLGYSRKYAEKWERTFGAKKASA